MTSPSGGSQYQQGAGAPGTPTGPKITSIFDFTAEALEELAFFLEQRGLHIPVSQLLGFQQFTAQPATTVDTSQTTASTSYTDLATTGPTITGLPDGKYLILFGALMSVSTGGPSAAMSVQVNATAATDSDSAQVGTSTLGSASRAITKTLSNGGNNSLTAKYKITSAATATFQYRWLIAIRYANL